MSLIFLSEPLQQQLNPKGQLDEDALFDAIMNLSGESIRAMEGRHTFRLQLGAQRYFIKQHWGIGYAEILKDLTTAKRPVLGARNEYEAIEHLWRAGIATMTLAGFGERGKNPAKRESFIITEALENTLTLKDVTNQWLEQPTNFAFKLKLFREVTRTARVMHQSGLNHRDFYLCHFRIPEKQLEDSSTKAPQLFLMDLHRAQIRPQVPLRWRVKDIGALYFSAAHLPLTQRDLLRFMRDYSGKPLRQTLADDRAFWIQVLKRARKFYMRDWKHPMPELLKGE